MRIVKTDKLLTLEDMAAAQAELDKISGEMGQTLVKEKITEFLDKFPEVEALAWTQYTPYFNDGEPCTFGFGGLYMFTTDMRNELVNVIPEGTPAREIEDYHSIWEWKDSYGFGTWEEDLDTTCYRKATIDGVYQEDPNQPYHPNKWVLHENTKEMAENFKELESLLGSNKNTLLLAFGDHSKIIATREEIIIDEYDHD